MSCTKIIHLGISIVVEFVTPQIARKWLDKNIGNRSVRDRVIKQYSRDMQNGDWLFKPVAICFDENGHLGNGQHTLNAIVKSGIGTHLLIARGVPRESIAVMDVGIKRTFTDIANFLGNDLNKDIAAVSKVINSGPQNSDSCSFNELLECYNNHKEAIDFALNELKGHKCGVTSVVISVVARAHYTKDHNKLSRFCDVLKSGVGAGAHESSAIKLRDFLMSGRAGNASASRVEVYQKTQSALSYFLLGKPMSKIYGTESELYPIPAHNGDAA